jgi:hypothetical protein
MKCAPSRRKDSPSFSERNVVDQIWLPEPVAGTAPEPEDVVVLRRNCASTSSGRSFRTKSSPPAKSAVSEQVFAQPQMQRSRSSAGPRAHTPAARCNIERVQAAAPPSPARSRPGQASLSTSLRCLLDKTARLGVPIRLAVRGSARTRASAVSLLPGRDRPAPVSQAARDRRSLPGTQRQGAPAASPPPGRADAGVQHQGNPAAAGSRLCAARASR